ncbi:MAG: STAS domain-containing protein [Terrimicrobiaceae bacterium]
MSTPSSVLVGSLGRTVWLKVNGRGTFQTSPGVKEFVKQMIQRGHREFVVDLGDCELMDSTFMGTLAGVALRLREIGQGGLRAVNVNIRNSSLLENLGLDHLFTVETGVIAAAPVLLTEADQGKEKDAKDAVLEAHEALIRADAHNAVKFKDVVEYLRQELAQENRADD